MHVEQGLAIDIRTQGTGPDQLRSVTAPANCSTSNLNETGATRPPGAHLCHIDSLDQAAVEERRVMAREFLKAWFKAF